MRSDNWGIFIAVTLILLGSMELRGRSFLLSGFPKSKLWLVSSQVGLLIVISSYCIHGLISSSAQLLDNMPPALLSQFKNSLGPNGEWEDFLRPITVATYSIFLVVSIGYQGGMAFYYYRKVPLALREPPPLPLVEN